MKRTILAAIAIAVLSCNIALAAEPGAYVSASVGSAEQKLSAEGVSVTESDIAFQIAGGYRFTPNVGVEVGYTNLGNAQISAQGMTASSKPQAIHAAVTGMYNLTPSSPLPVSWARRTPAPTCMEAAPATRNRKPKHTVAWCSALA